MSSGSRRLFIYYRLDEQALVAAVPAVQAAQQALRQQHPGLNAQLLQAPAPSSGGERTLMETYAMHTPGGVDEALQGQIESALQLALRPWLGDGRRHLEVFIDLPCAS